MKLSLSHKTIIVLLAMTLTFVCPNLCALPGPGEASSIPVMQNSVQGAPKESSIQASINGHVLSVVFTENLGQVAIDISTAAGATVDYNSIHTPNGVNFYIPNTGSYIVTFTLPNNDVYYGEFEVTD